MIEENLMNLMNGTFQFSIDLIWFLFLLYVVFFGVTANAIWINRTVAVSSKKNQRTRDNWVEGDFWDITQMQLVYNIFSVCFGIWVCVCIYNVYLYSRYFMFDLLNLSTQS